eukprot:134191_1
MGCCQSPQETEELATQAGNQIGYALLEKGKEKANATSSKLLTRVETTFDDTMDKMINKKLLEKCDSTFDKAVDTFINKTVERAMEKIVGEDEDYKSEEEADDGARARLLTQVKQRKEDAQQTLRVWGLPQLLIETMDAEGWLDADNWHVLTKEELKNLGFGNGHIELFINGMRERKQRQSKQQQPDQERDTALSSKYKANGKQDIDMLSEWGIPSNLIDKMEEDGWGFPQYWDDLLEHEYELYDLGFKNGHISTFKRKFKEWKEDQDSQVTDRKVQLLRKLEKSQNQQYSILKRNIDVENSTNNVLQVRIISERRYDSFASKYDSKSQAKNQSKTRELAASQSAQNRVETNAQSQIVSDEKRSKGFGGSLGVTVVTTPLNANVGANYAKEDIKRNEETRDESQVKQRSNEQETRNKRASKRFAAQSNAKQNVSQHKWEKVDVGFTDVLPTQTIRFPVQINEPNSVVYMTIYIPSERRNVCKNVQIDSNYIKIETVNGSVQWQNFIKMPKNNKFDMKKGEQHTNEDGIVFMHEFVDGLNTYLHQKGDLVADDSTIHLQQLLNDSQFDVNKKNDCEKLIQHIQKAWHLCDKMYAEQDKAEHDTEALIEYINLRKDMTNFKREQRDEMFDRAAQKYEDNDSDDEELYAVSRFFDVHGYSLLKKWKLEQFYERMAQEGWETPLDWIHLDDHIMRQNLGFRPGHIQIFNRKFDLWVKKYNEVRRTIEPKKKGKDGTLIVGENEIKFLKGNYYYEFTKVIIRKGGTLTTKAWSPKFEVGGVLFLKSHQEIVLEKDASIDVSGKGYWGAISANPKQKSTLGAKGMAPGDSGGMDSRGWRYSDHRYGAGGGGYGSPGYDGFTPESKEETADEYIGHGGKIPRDSMKGFREMEIFIVNNKEYTKYFEGDGPIRESMKHEFQNAMGSGGGTYAAKNIKDKKRGGTGGGAIKLQCDKLIMYQNSKILANGAFHESKDPLSSGGSGGSIYLSVKSQIVAKNKDEKDKTFIVQANGGGWNYYDEYMKHKDNKQVNDDKDYSWIQQWKQYEWPRDENEDQNAKNQKMRIGFGGNGRIRIDYHSPLILQLQWCNPRPFVE